MEELRARGKALEKRRRELQEELQEARHTKEEEQEQQSGFSSFTVAAAPVAVGVKIPLGTSTVAAKEVRGEEELQQRRKRSSLQKEQEEVSCWVFFSNAYIQVRLETDELRRSSRRK